jgi:hypothetical protein
MLLTLMVISKLLQEMFINTASVWSSCHRLQIRGLGFDSRRYQILPRITCSGTGFTRPREDN